MLEGQLNIVYVADGSGKDLPPIPFRGSDAEHVQQGRPKVLVVDDQKLIADTLCEILEMSGYHVQSAYDGWAALDLLDRFRPDILLSDVLMPKMNGVELAIAVSKLCPKTRILLFSGQAGISEILQEGQRAGYDFEVMPKPIHPSKLIQRLKGFH